MPDNLPNQATTEDAKLKELEQELHELEQRAQGEMNESSRQQPTPTVAAVPQNPATGTPQAQSPQETSGDQKGEAGNKGARAVMWVAVILLLLSVVGAAGYFFGMRSAPPVATPTPTTTPTPTPTQIPTSGWETYTDDAGWSIKYPKGLEVTENAVVTFLMFGPTQKEGTEFYDGISLTIRSGALGGETLRAFVDDKAQEIGDDPLSEVTAGPTQTTVANLSGYRLTATGLGTFEYYYLPLGASGYLEIVDATQDPTGEGFAGMVEAMLTSIEVTSVSLVPSPTARATATPSATP